MAMIFPCYILF